MGSFHSSPNAKSFRSQVALSRSNIKCVQSLCLRVRIKSKAPSICSQTKGRSQSKKQKSGICFEKQKEKQSRLHRKYSTSSIHDKHNRIHVTFTVGLSPRDMSQPKAKEISPNIVWLPSLRWPHGWRCRDNSFGCQKYNWISHQQISICISGSQKTQTQCSTSLPELHAAQCHQHNIPTESHASETAHCNENEPTPTPPNPHSQTWTPTVLDLSQMSTSLKEIEYSNAPI